MDHRERASLLIYLCPNTEVWGCIGTASGKVIVWVVRVEEVTTLSSFYPSISHLNHATTMDRGAHAAAISGAWSVYLPFSWTCD